MIYLYCLLPAEIEVDVEGLPSMEEGQPLYLLCADRLKAAVSEVGEEFAEANLNARIRDLEWLSPRAVRHHDAVDGLYTRCHWLLPMTFGAIFRSDETLRQRLEAGQQELRGRLDQLRGREEWDVKLSRDEAEFAAQLASQSSALQQLQREVATKPPGTRFLLEKKQQNLRAQEAKRLSAHVRADAQRALAAAAVDSHLDELAPAGPGLKVRLELRGAYLIGEGQDGALKDAAGQLAEKYGPMGYSLEVTGPWPAFSFAGGLQDVLA